MLQTIKGTFPFKDHNKQESTVRSTLEYYNLRSFLFQCHKSPRSPWCGKLWVEVMRNEPGASDSYGRGMQDWIQEFIRSQGLLLP